MRVALASCLHPPEADKDADLLRDAVRARGVDAEWVAWNDPKADFAAYDLCVLRSTWDYIHELDAFLAWAGRIPRGRLLNPPDVVRWNADKEYLRELEKRGVPVVPTVYVPRGAAGRLADVLGGRGWDDVVIKPRVGAASFATRRFSAGNAEADEFLAALAAERDVMIQPYVASVEGHGERSLVWIDGEPTHAVRKTPRFGGQDERVSTALAIADDERAFGAKLLAPWGDRLLYARVDVARDERGGLLLMELELIEPSLFLLQEPRALERFADAIARRPL